MFQGSGQEKIERRGRWGEEGGDGGKEEGGELGEGMRERTEYQKRSRACVLGGRRRTSTGGKEGGGFIRYDLFYITYYSISVYNVI